MSVDVPLPLVYAATTLLPALSASCGVPVTVTGSLSVSVMGVRRSRPVGSACLR